MIIKKLSAKSFGKLKNINIEFSQGMNVVYGPNESGKSTIQTFIKGMFYGLNKKIKKDELSEFDKYQPWDGSEYAGIIEYDESGFFYRVGRNFMTNKVSVCNEFWDDVTEQFPIDKKKGSLFAEKHIGLSEECFMQTIFIRQLETKIKDDTKELVDRLINLQETGQEDVSFKNALEALDNAIKNIGNDRTSKKPLNIINMQIDELKKEKNEVSKLRNENLQIQEEIKQSEERKQEILQHIEELKNIKQIIKKDNLLDLYNKAKDYENRIESIENDIKRLQVFSDFPVHFEERVRELLLGIKNYQNSLLNKRTQLEEIESKIESAATGETIQENDKDLVYKAISEFEIIKQTNKEIQDYREKIEQYSQSDESEEEALEQNDQLVNAVTKLNQLMTDSEQIRVKMNKNERYIDYSLNDLDKKILEYKELSEDKEKLKNLTKQEDKITQEIVKINNVLNELKNYAKLNNVEGILNQRNRNNDLTYDLFNSKAIKARNKNILLSLIMVLSFGLLGFGFLNISFGNLSYIFILLGIVGIIGGGVLLINGLRNSRVKSNSGYKDSKELIQMYQVVGAPNFDKFIKGWHEYKNAAETLSILNSDLKNIRHQIEELKDNISKIDKSISDMLETLNIFHTTEVNDAHILMLKQSFSNMLSSEYSQKDVTKIMESKNEILKTLSKIIGTENLVYMFDIIRSKRERDINVQDILKKISIKNDGYIDDENLREYSISQIKNSIQKLTQKVIDLKESIKSVLDKFEINYSNEIQEEHINMLKQKFDNLFKASSEVLGLKAVRDNLSSEISVIEEALNILEREKKEILDSSDAEDENEYFEGCQKNKNVKELLTEKHRICKTYDELLNGETSENILNKVSSISNNKKVDVSNFEIENVEANLDKLKEELKSIEENILTLKHKTESMLHGKQDLNEIDEQIEWLTMEEEQLRSKRDSLEVALDILKESSREIQRDFSPKFQKEISKIISRVTGGKYEQAKTNENLNINVIDPTSGQVVEVDKLSSGTIEQFYLSLRIALANILSEGKDQLPLIIDEAFVQYDDSRIRNVIEFLYELSNERQIIIFTCQNRELDIIRELGLMKKVNIIELG